MVKVSFWTAINRGNTLGKFQVTMENGLCIHCFLINSRYGPFIDMPKKVYDKDGETKYLRLVYFEDVDKDKAFKQEVLQILEKQEGLKLGRSEKPKAPSQEAAWEL